MCHTDIPVGPNTAAQYHVSSGFYIKFTHDEGSKIYVNDNDNNNNSKYLTIANEYLTAKPKVQTTKDRQHGYNIKHITGITRQFNCGQRGRDMVVVYLS